MGKFRFRHLLQPSGRFVEPVDEQLKPGSDERDLAIRAGDVALAAIDICSGQFPVEYPFSVFGAHARLPWHQQYWEFGEHYDLRKEGSQEQLVAAIYQIVNLLEVGIDAEDQGDELTNPWGHALVNPHLNSNQQLLICGLAVQALICADEVFDLLIGDQCDTTYAGINLARAYENMFIAARKAEPLLAGVAVNGRKGGLKRAENDPKTADKKFIYDCWKDWKANPSRYSGRPKFVSDMLDKVQYLSGSQQVIERWIRGWERQHTQGVQ